MQKQNNSAFKMHVFKFLRISIKLFTVKNYYIYAVTKAIFVFYNNNKYINLVTVHLKHVVTEIRPVSFKYASNEVMVKLRIIQMH